MSFTVTQKYCSIRFLSQSWRGKNDAYDVCADIIKKNVRYPILQEYFHTISVRFVFQEINSRLIGLAFKIAFNIRNN